MIIRLPQGYAREAYLLMRKRGKSVLESLLAASVVDACPADEMQCARCKKLLDVRDHVRVQGRDVVCGACVLTPTGNEQQEQSR